MPIYEYACPDCSHRFEILQRLGEGGGDLDCPQCGHRGVDKRFSTFAGHTSGAPTALADAGCGKANCCALERGGFGCEN
jgi:putative FmdB family regulatory protein